MKPQPRYQKGDRIGGRYLVHQALMGGMGEVYLCLDEETMYPYALKTFQQRYLAQSQHLRRAFEQEVLAWVTLEKHPNIVRCFYMQNLDNQPFMVLEWVAGEEDKGVDLRDWLRQGPLTLRQALDFAIDICYGLVHAQQKQPGIVHRDLKPENILVAQGGLAKITDFGLAQIVVQANLEVEGLTTPKGAATTSPQQSLAAKGGAAGTPPYMPPEQWQPGAVLDERADIYALGCILYEMLTGRLPFTVEIAPTTRATYQRWLSAWQAQHEEAERPLPSVQIPPPVITVIHNCLAVKRDDRPVSAGELLAELKQLYDHLFGIAPRPEPKSGELTAGDYNNRGATYAILGQHEAALVDFNQAVEFDPTDAQVYTNRGHTYHALEKYEAALADYSRAIDLDPNDATAYASRGRTYAGLRHYDVALADYSRALRLDPTNARAYAFRGNTYADLRQYKEALVDYSQAIEFEATDATVYHNRGLTHHNLRQHKEALADYDRAIEIDPTLASVYYNRGNTYASLEQHEAAVADFSYAIELDPIDAEAYYNRGNSYARLGQYEQALTDYSQVTTLDPAHAKAYLNIGAVLGNQGQFREALSYFEKAAELGDPRGVQYTRRTRERLDDAFAPGYIQATQASSAFLKAGSPAAMSHAVAQYPFMTNGKFIAGIEQIINQLPLEQRSTFIQRLTWLRQIAAKQ
jgi:tetratricopeptide (TPR) repeat protein